MTSIHNAQSVNQLITPPTLGSKTEQSDAASFKGFLLESIQDVNSMQQQADQAVETLMTGGDADPAEVLTAVQKADMAFRLMMQMRNKMMQVYQEVRDIRI
jgi:flagellar hook-basal body complex protein FliE